MAVPKKRTSHARQGTRRSHLAIASKVLIVCPNCGKATLPHHACSACGYYRGRQVVKV